MKSTKLILKILNSLKTDKERKDFLEGILTNSEVEQILMRIEIIKMLKKGIPQHQIAEKLGVGVATVSRGAKMLKEGKFDYI